MAAAATFRKTCDEGGGFADDCPVLRCGPDIFRDRLGTVEGLDEFCHLRIGTCRLEGQMNVEGSFTQKNLISCMSLYSYGNSNKCEYIDQKTYNASKRKQKIIP